MTTLLLKTNLLGSCLEYYHFIKRVNIFNVEKVMRRHQAKNVFHQNHQSCVCGVGYRSPFYFFKTVYCNDNSWRLD